MKAYSFRKVKSRVVKYMDAYFRYKFNKNKPDIIKYENTT